MKYFKNTAFAVSLVIGFFLVGTLYVSTMAAMVVSILFGKFIEFQIAYKMYIEPLINGICTVVMRLEWWAVNPPLGYFINDPRVKK